MARSLFAFLFFLSTAAHAGFQGSLEFSEADIALHQERLETFLDTASSCLREDLERHQDFIKAYGVSAFYGDHSAFAVKTGPDGKKVSTTAEEKRAKLRAAGVSESLAREMVPDQACAGGIAECPRLLEPTSCIGLALKCLGKAFQSTGQTESWTKLRAYVRQNNTTGNAVLDGLQKLGWKLAYWNPDPKKNESWDAQEQKDYPGNPLNIWGQHAATWESVRARHQYYLNSVDDWSALVGFKIIAPPKTLKRAKFFVGIAHLGYHVFPGSEGRVIEGHSTREITDKHTVEESRFSPMSFFGGGGPRGGPYKSGLIALPPGVLE